MGILKILFGKEQEKKPVKKSSPKKKNLPSSNVKKILQKEIKKQRELARCTKQKTCKKAKKEFGKELVKTGITGLDALMGKGIPKGAVLIIAGGPGSGKTIMGLQIANHAAVNKEKTIYISLEEHPNKLKSHMRDFGWDSKALEKKGLLKIRRVDPFAISRNVEALLAKAKGELSMDIDEIGGLIPKDFNPKWVVMDSITALQSAFREEEDTYRIYIEQLFKYFENLGATVFLISETEDIAKKQSGSSAEEFLADGVILLYHIKKRNIRERAIEVLKLRGIAHENKIVVMQISVKVGIEVYPKQEIFGGVQ